MGMPWFGVFGILEGMQLQCVLRFVGLHRLVWWQVSMVWYVRGLCLRGAGYRSDV